MNYRADADFSDFIEYNDLGLPLAYLLSEKIVSGNKEANTFIDETFDLLLAALGLEDEGYDVLDDLLARSME